MAKTAYVVSLFSELTILREYRPQSERLFAVASLASYRARSMIAIGGLQPESIVTSGSLDDILPFTSGRMVSSGFGKQATKHRGH